MDKKKENRSKNSSKILLAVLCMVCLVILADKDIAKATKKKLEILPTDVTTPSDGCTFVGIEGKYAAQVQNALKRVNKIRKEACKEGVPNPSNPAKKLTAADYVPIRWSSDLEYIARIRAAEAAVLVGHERPNGKDSFSLKAPDGSSSYNEVLAWHSGLDAGMIKGINQWYREKKDWAKQNQNAMTIHYSSMIDPKNKYIGLAAFISGSGAWKCAVSGEFGTEDSSSSSALDNTGSCIQIIEVKKNRLKGLQIFKENENTSNGLVLGVGKQSALTAKVKVVIDGDTSYCNYLDKITWKSSNPSVAKVSSSGCVTVKKAGNAVITASAKNMKSTSCKLIIAPKVTSLTSLEGGYGYVILHWKRQKHADGYYISVSEKKSLDNESIEGIQGYIDGNKNTTHVVGNLGRNQTYYVRVRTCKKIGDRIIWSDWSKVKKVRTK